MSKAVVFVIAFLLLFVITLVIPALPPGDIISSFVGLPETISTTSILGISGVVIVNGIINGFVWGIIVFVIYALTRRPPKRKALPPMLSPTYQPAPVPAPTPATTSITMSRKPREKRRHPQVKKRKTYIALDQDIETIEGIGPTYGNKLRNSGVKVVGDLLKAGSTRSGRRVLANKIGVASGILLKWVYRADFFRIRGIGTQYSALLESAGVNTVPDLSRRNPKNLYAKLRAINRKKNLVRRVPPYRTVQVWIKSAKNLKRIVED